MRNAADHAQGHHAQGHHAQVGQAQVRQALRLSLSLAGTSRAGLRLEGDGKRAMEVGRRRVLVTMSVFAVLFLTLALRVTEIGVLGGAAPPARAGTKVEHRVGRLDIVDRNGVLLATNLPTASLYADARRVIDVDETARSLAAVLPDSDVADLRRRLASGRAFVWLHRGLTPSLAAHIHALGLPGVAFVEEERRVYPQGTLLAHVLGFTDVDNQGIAGIERTADERLRRGAVEGAGPFAVSIDVRLQAVLHEEITAAIETFQAVGGTGIIMDALSGDVLALVSLPDFDPNQPTAVVSPDARFNRATLGIYEMGSIFKIFTTAMTLDYGVAGLDDRFDATNPIRVARYTINDSHPKARVLSVPEVFIYSSNIGAAKMGLAVGAARQRAFLKKLGLLDPASIELPEIGTPMAPATWGELATMTIAFGHGVAVSPLQTVAAFAAVVNGGTRVQPTLFKRSAAAEPGQRVIGAATSDAMRALLRLTVLEGTGKAADVAGYAVGGKTGTAEKVANGGYQSSALLSSFIGAFPMAAPRYVILVTIDEPKGNESTFGYATGGWTAAPTVARVVARMAPLVGVAPEAPRAPGAEGDGAGDMRSILASLQSR
ncbi:MAG: peptidoglycan D,D-transpeptidase FtsI family protein [Alphaproteobacteria bacterium]